MKTKIQFLASVFLIYLFIGNAFYAKAETTRSETTRKNNTTGPDLIITDFFPMDTDSIRENFSGYLICSMKNIGDTHADGGYTAAYFSSDTLLSEGDPMVAKNGANGLPPGESEFTTIHFTIPDVPASGYYYLLIKADSDNHVNETNENNNISYYTVRVYVPKIDLTISQVSITDTVFTIYSYPSVTFSITHSGDTESDFTETSIRISTDTIPSHNDYILTYIFTPSLAIGSTHQQTIPIEIPHELYTDDYYILLEVDNGFNAETNEGNNIAYLPVRILGKEMDLSISDLSVSDTVYSNSFLRFEYAVFYEGNNNEAYTHGLSYLSSDTIISQDDLLLADDIVYPIYANNSLAISKAVELPQLMPQEDYYLILNIDVGNYNLESNELNNIAYKKIKVLAPDIDAAVTNIAVSDTLISHYSFGSIEYTISNTGVTEAANTRVLFFLSSDNNPSEDDYTLALDSVVSVPGTSSITQTAYFNNVSDDLLPGNYYLIAKADYFDVSIETNETNNEAHIAVSIVSPLVDLGVENIQTASAITISQNNTIAFNVHNYGAGNVSVTTANIYLSTDSIFDPSNDINVLAVSSEEIEGGTATFISDHFNVPANLTPGNYYLLVVSDIHQEIAETDEDNNVSKTLVNLIAPDIDLYVHNPRLNRINVTAGTPVIAINYIANNGSMTAIPTSTRYYLSSDINFDSATDVLLGTTNVGEVRPGYLWYETFEVTIPYYTPTGDYYILYVADALNAQTEKNETNNVAYKALKVTEVTVDLSVKSTKANKTTVVAGTSLNLTCNVQNSGNGYAYNSYLVYYLSTDTSYSPNDVYLGEQFINSIGNKTSAAFTTTVAIPSSTAAGNYYFIYVADGFNNLNETNEGNNTGYKSIRVTRPAVRSSFATEAEENGNMDVLVAPNPVGDELKVHLSGVNPENEVIFTLYDLNGAQVFSSTARGISDLYVIPAKDLREGIYLLKIVSNSFVKTIKILKQ